jgi:ribonuclease BN (tRNA processing enzyme)
LRLTLLGTAGGPPPHIDRSQPASLLQVDGKSYLIDAGENVGQQALKAGVPPSRIDATFITHLHWDHVLGLNYLMATGWMMGRTVPMSVTGPPGLSAYMKSESAALGIGEDIFRPQMPSRPALAGLYPVREVNLTGPAEVYRDKKVRVTAVPGSHFGTVPGRPHAYGPDKGYAYRFDTAFGSVTFTGDTGPSDAVTALAHGSDILVSEICDLDSIGRALVAAEGPGARLDALMAHMREEHLSPEAVGRMASASGVKKLVLSHFAMGRGVDPQSLIAKIRPFYAGEIIAGQDLMTIDIGR